MERHRTYPEYRVSDTDWLDTLPSHWSSARLKLLCRFTGGGTPSKDNLEYWDGNIPWVSPKDMKSDSISGSIDKITSLGLANSTSNLVPAGSVLVVFRSGILRNCLPVGINTLPVALNQDMKAVIANGKVTAKFLFYLLKGQETALLHLWRKAGATVESLEQEDVANTTIPIPSVQEQAQVAAFLDHETAKIDRLIAKQEELIALLKEKRQAVISHAVTKGLNPDAPMKDSGVEWLGEIPAHWKPMSLRHALIRIEQGKSPECDNRLADDSEWGVLKTGCVNHGLFRPDEHKAFPEMSAEFEAYVVRLGDVLMSRASGSTDLIGSVAKVDTCPYRLLLSDEIFRLVLSQSTIADGFIVYVMMSKPMRTQIELAISGAEGLANNITKESIKSLQLAIPPLHEQHAITNYIDRACGRIDLLITKSIKAVHLLKERRTALISATVTGKIDVREWKHTEPSLSLAEAS